MNLEPHDILALTRSFNDDAQKQASKSLEPGAYKIDVCVRITGTLKKGEDYEQKVVAKADPWGLLALALSKLNGVTVEALVAEHLAASETETSVIEERAHAAIKRVKAATVRSCTGKVTATLFIERAAFGETRTRDLDYEIKIKQDRIA